MSTARTADAAPLGLVQVGADDQQSQLTVSGLKRPVKPTSEVAHQPGQQPAAVDHLSLWCKVNRASGQPHHPCTGTCDSGHGTSVWCGRPCQCECHRAAVRQASKNAGEDLPIVDYFPPGVGERGPWIAMLPGDRLMKLLTEAGYTP